MGLKRRNMDLSLIQLGSFLTGIKVVHLVLGPNDQELIINREAFYNVWQLVGIGIGVYWLLLVDHTIVTVNFIAIRAVHVLIFVTVDICIAFNAM